MRPILLGLCLLAASAAPALAQVECKAPEIPFPFSAPGLIKVSTDDPGKAHEELRNYNLDMEIYLAAIDVYLECIGGKLALEQITAGEARRAERGIQIDRSRVLGNWSYAIKRLRVD